MTNVSLEVSGITFTFQDGDVNSCKGLESSNIDNSMISGMGPMGAWNYDYEGCEKKISISGVLTLSVGDRTTTGTCKTILAQKQWLESLINGQQEEITIISKYESESAETSAGGDEPNQADFTETECMVENMSFEEEAGNPHQLPFNMTLAVGEGIIIILTYLVQEDGFYIVQETGFKFII